MTTTADISLRLIDLRKNGTDLAKLLGTHLSPEEKQKASLMQEQKAQEYICSRGLLRQILGELTGNKPSDIVFATSDQGKPFVNDKSFPHFNISHTPGYICLAVGPLPTGIDIENSQRSVQPVRIAKRYFHESETKQLLSLEPQQQKQLFLYLWTLKEATIKLKDSTIAATGLDNLAFSISGNRITNTFSAAGWKNLCYQVYLHEQLIITLATDAKKTTDAELKLIAKDGGIEEITARKILSS